MLQIASRSSCVGRSTLQTSSPVITSLDAAHYPSPDRIDMLEFGFDIAASTAS